MERFNGQTGQWEPYDGIELVQLSRVTLLEVYDDDAWPTLVIGHHGALERVLQDYNEADRRYCESTGEDPNPVEKWLTDRGFNVIRPNRLALENVAVEAQVR